MNKKTTTQFIKGINKNWINKYTITLAVFLVWLLFFDKYNYFAKQKLAKTTEKLEQEYVQLQEDILVAKKEKQDIEMNHEKYGREKYFLHKENEDVFIIEKNENK